MRRIRGVAAIVVAFGLLGCADDSRATTGAGDAASSPVGRWELGVDELVRVMAPTAQSDAERVAAREAVRGTMGFELSLAANGTFSANQIAQGAVAHELKGSWRLDADTITLTTTTQDGSPTTSGSTPPKKGTFKDGKLVVNLSPDLRVTLTRK